MVVALVTLALLVDGLYAGTWEDLLKERVAMHIGIVVTVAAIIVLLALGGASLGWTGFADRTVWDWLDLLIVPAVLGLGGLWFAQQQDARQLEVEQNACRRTERLESGMGDELPADRRRPLRVDRLYMSHVTMTSVKEQDHVA
jgi:hypothetical protein